MTNITPKIVLTTGFSIAAIFLAGKVFAGECTPIYGGGVSCPKRGEIIIDKQIANPDSGVFVDNLTEFDAKFDPEEEITFRLFLRNTGNESINEIEVKDIFPDFTTFISGPGEFKREETKNGTLTFKVFNLAAGESREYWIRAKAFPAKDLPENTICKIVNRAQAKADDRFNEDLAQFCIARQPVTKGGVPVVKEVPKTGAAEMALLGVSFSALTGIGLKLRKNAEKILN